MAHMTNGLATAAPPLTFKDIVSVVWRRRYMAIIAFAAAAVAVLLVTRQITPMFESEASLEVERGRRTVDFQTDSCLLYTSDAADE